MAASKLVRDRIPERMSKNGDIPILLNAIEGKTLEAALCRKLCEECRKLYMAGERRQIFAEFADIREVESELFRYFHLPVPALALECRGPSGDPDPRPKLYLLSRSLVDATEKEVALKRFHALFLQVLEYFCICGEELEQKLKQKRTSHGGFAKRLYLVKAIPVEDISAYV